jgi:hypothetical protein
MGGVMVLSQWPRQAAGAVAGSRNRALRIASGLALLAASACTRFGVFRAGIASAQDPQATVAPQQRRRSVSSN